jgi:hypothetical protein
MIGKKKDEPVLDIFASGVEFFALLEDYLAKILPPVRSISRGFFLSSMAGRAEHSYRYFSFDQFPILVRITRVPLGKRYEGVGLLNSPSLSLLKSHSP